MDDIDSQVVFDFAMLFRGGKVAIDDPADAKGFRPWQTDSGGFIPADGKDFIEIIEDHLLREPHIGVYPLFHNDDGFKVHWGCIDWDSGLEESLVHARNVREVLRQVDVVSHVERSRSKGCHLWVFFTNVMPAFDVRTGLIGACDVVDAPTKEVNPKQVELSNRGWGNGVRLPYGKNRRPGGYNEMMNPDVSFSKIPVQAFTKEAMASRVTPEAWEAVTALYSPPEAPFGDEEMPEGHAVGVDLRGLSGAIRKNGPRTTSDKPHGDRSSTLFSLACAMIRDGYELQVVAGELEGADIEWGGKYARRPDGRQRLWKMVLDAKKLAWEPKD
jgi:hypothetical protein|tara:strand:+ start:1214 stop:2200 length:987 start_codon:yes stop_codon:yes gene_type:complete